MVGFLRQASYSEAQAVLELTLSHQIMKAAHEPLVILCLSLLRAEFMFLMVVFILQWHNQVTATQTIPESLKHLLYRKPFQSVICKPNPLSLVFLV